MYIVMTASAPAHFNNYRRVAVVQVETPDTRPAMISTRARGVIRVVKTWEHCYDGKTSRCAYQRALAEAIKLRDELNKTLNP